MADKVFKFIIAPAVGSRYKPIRGDKISQPGMITTQVLQNVIDSELVIADLTDGNPNVYYELAVRHSFDKPSIQLIKKGQQIPFNVHGLRTIEYALDAQDVADAVKELRNQIKSIESGVKMDTPISVLQGVRYPERINIEKTFMNITPMKAEEMIKRFSDNW
jgi:hypothetical protein